MALPVSAGFQAQIDQILAGLTGLPGQFNPRRRASAYDAAASLNEQGYSSDAMPEEVSADGSVTYRIVRGQDGRLYQQAFRQNANQANARGTYFSSFTERAQQDSRRQLDAARNAILRQADSQQQSLTSDQLARDQDMRGNLGTLRGQYSDWQAAQPVPTPQAPEPPPPAAATPAPPSAPQTAPTGPRRAMSYQDFLRGRASTGALARQWDSSYNFGRRFG